MGKKKKENMVKKMKRKGGGCRDKIGKGRRGSGRLLGKGENPSN